MDEMDRILGLTEQVERQIENGDWLSASETDAERRQLLVAMLDANGVGRLNEHEKRCLREILQRTNDTVAEVRSLKRDLLASSIQLQNAPRAIDSYQQNVQRDTLAQLRD